MLRDVSEYILEIQSLTLPQQMVVKNPGYPRSAFPGKKTGLIVSNLTTGRLAFRTGTFTTPSSKREGPGEGLRVFLAGFGLSFVAHLLVTMGFADHRSAVLIDKMALWRRIANRCTRPDSTWMRPRSASAGPDRYGAGHGTEHDDPADAVENR